MEKGGVLSWLAEKKGDVKQCPKCGEAIEKDAGCNHMKCACGHDFCWLCLGPFPNCKCGHFEEESRREAARLQQQDRRRDRYGGGYVYDPYGPLGEGLPAATLIEHWRGRWSSRSACSGRGAAGAGAVAAGGGPARRRRHGAGDGRVDGPGAADVPGGRAPARERRAADAVEEEAPMSGVGNRHPGDVGVASHAEGAVLV